MAKILTHKIVLFALGVLVGVVVLNSCARFDRKSKTEYQPERIGSIEYIALDSLCYKFNMECDWQPKKDIAILKKNQKELTLLPKTQSVLLEGKSKPLLFPMIEKGDRLMVPRELEKLQWWSEAQTNVSPERLFKESLDSKFVVVVDAGHGGNETGAVANGIQEKDITFRVAQFVQRDLEAAGIKVIMTRDTDDYLSLPDRTWMAAQVNANLFVSIHGNSAPNDQASGIETFHIPAKFSKSKATVHDSDSSDKDYRMRRNALLKKEKTIEEIDSTQRKKSAELAELVHKQMIKSDPTIKDRGVKQAEFFVLKWMNRPSILIELGFVTNFLEGNRLMNPEYQEALARAITTGILEYQKKNP